MISGASITSMVFKIVDFIQGEAVMNDELEQLKNDIELAKAEAAEKMGMLHDLVEGGLPGDFNQLPHLSYECYEACKHWADLTAELKDIELN